MPVVLATRASYHFYSNEGEPREPVHIHVRGSGRKAKFWFRPRARLASNAGFNLRELRELIAVIESNRARIEEAWHAYFV